MCAKTCNSEVEGGNSFILVIWFFWISNIIKLSWQNLEFFEKRLEFFRKFPWVFFSLEFFWAWVILNVQKKPVLSAYKALPRSKPGRNGRELTRDRHLFASQVNQWYFTKMIKLATRSDTHTPQNPSTAKSTVKKCPCQFASPAKLFATMCPTVRGVGTKSTATSCRHNHSNPMWPVSQNPAALSTFEPAGGGRCWAWK